MRRLGAVWLVAGCTLTPLAACGRSSTSTTASTTVVLRAAPRITATIPLGQFADHWVTADGALWGIASRSILSVNERDGVVSNTPLPADVSTPLALAVTGGGVIWVVDFDGAKFPGPNAGLVRLDPATDRVAARLKLGGDLVLAASSAAVWAASNAVDLASQRLTKVDPATNSAAWTTSLPLRNVVAVVPLADAVWVLGSSDQGAGLVKVATADGALLARVPLPEPDYTAMATGSGGLWLSAVDGGLQFIDGTGRLGSRVDAPRSSWIAASNSALWVLDLGVKGAMTASARAIDPSSGQSIAEVNLPRGEHQTPDAVLVDGGVVWVPDGPDLIRVQPG